MKKAAGWLDRIYCKYLVAKDYRCGEHYLRVSARRSRTIERLRNQIETYSKREPELKLLEIELNKKRGELQEFSNELGEREKTITGKDEELAKKYHSQEWYEQRILSLTEEVRLAEQNVTNHRVARENAEKKAFALEKKVHDYYERKIGFQEGAIKKLRKSQMHLLIEEVSENADKKDLIAIVDENDCLLYGTPALVKLFGYDPLSSKEKKDYHVFFEHPEDAESLEEDKKTTILPLKTKKGEQFFKVTPFIYTVSVESLREDERQIPIHIGAKVKFEELGWSERRKLERDKEEKIRQERDAIKLREKQANILSIKKMIENAEGISFLHSKNGELDGEIKNLEEGIKKIAEKYGVDYDEIKLLVRQEILVRDWDDAIELNKKYSSMLDDPQI